jgi:adenine-specific DNA-methyltransferase
MAKIEVSKTELVWPGKYNEDGTLKEVPRVNLPFQVIETVNESRATREVQKTKSLGLFDIYEGKEGDTFDAGWRNKLIWGDNLLVMGSLLEKFAGKIDLIYIDPPFATGADFSFTAAVGDSNLELAKTQSAIEEKVYRDTWGDGIYSYLSMISQRLYLMRELLSDRGAIYVHVDPRVSEFVRLIMNPIFGSENFQNEIAWCYVGGRVPKVAYGRRHDTILFYSKADKWIFNWAQVMKPLNPEAAAKYKYEDEKGRYRLMGRCLKGSPIRAARDVSVDWEKKHPELTYRYYMKEGTLCLDYWDDLPPINQASSERTGYPTQKPEDLLERIVTASSEPNSIVADFFCGSGTALVVAEKLGRRWIGCDLGRWGVHVSRKRLLGTENCKPFEVLNLGKYERQYWQGVTFGEKKDKALTEQALYEYLAFILKLYAAQPVAGMEHLHGKKGKAMVHIGAVDAPVTIAEIDAAVDECAKCKQGELHVLGWEWEMGIHNLMVEAAKKKGIKLVPLIIPREVMEQQAAAKGDVRFFELAYLEAEIKQPKKLTAQVSLKDFVIPNTELIPEEVRSKVKKWSDYIDYWAVDWDFRNDTFMQGWVAYRTRQERKLPLVCDPHKYEKPGKYRILVKVIDIFGNDTSQAFDVEAK